jgi:hypothetical protein
VAGRDGVKFQLLYRARNLRPVFVHRWSAPGRVRTECAEALEPLYSTRPGVRHRRTPGS